MASVLILLPVWTVNRVLAGGTKHSAAPGMNEINTDAALLAVYVLLTLGFSFLCSVAEAVFLSVTPLYIEGLKEKKPKYAALLGQLKQDRVDQSLAAILTLNTIAHTVGAIVAGAKATSIFGSAWFGLFSGIMTLMILFFSEIIPKTIGAVYWAKLAVPTAIFVHMLIITLYPIVWLSEKLTILITRGKKLHDFTREEFLTMAQLGENSGYIEKKESQIIRNLFRLDSLKVTDIMTPRTVISAFPEDMSIADALKHIPQTSFSRLPLYKSNIDEISGFVLKDEVLISGTYGPADKKLKSLKRDILAVPDSISLPVLLEHFLKDRQHISIIVDEYGGTEGLVTLEDLVETLIGIEIMDETDSVEDMRELAQKQWKQRVRELSIEGKIVEQDREENEVSPE
ncbi:MAG: hemolysin family protein [Desulfococcaceae bacterium]|nr:hemolysin family protein [Desulfococcaceae bacterium]